MVDTPDNGTVTALVQLQNLNDAYLEVVRVVDPQVDLATAAASRLGSTLDLSPEGTQAIVRREVVRNLPSLRALPGLVEDLGLQLRSGQARLQVDVFSGPGSRTAALPASARPR